MDPTPRILVIDDDPATPAALAGRYALIPAAGPGAGLRLFGQTQPDLALLSTALGGWKLCAQLRAASRAPIILLADQGETGEAIKAFELGADAFLTRPVPPPLLRARIDSLLRRVGRRGGELPASTVCLAGQVYRAVDSNGSGETRFSLTNADGFFFVRTRLKNVVFKEKAEILVIGRLRSSFDRRCRGHHGWLQAERILPLPRAKSLWREGALEALLAEVR